MIYLELFLGFLEIGCFAFGGAYGAIPLIRDVVLSRSWLDEEMLAYMIAVSESSPGPIMVNLATYIGSSQAGLPGAVIATLSVIFPSFFAVLAVMELLTHIINNQYIQAAFRGLKPCIIGMILATGCYMLLRSIRPDTASGFDVRALAMATTLSLLYFGSKKFFPNRISPILLIVLSALLGMVLYGK